jgi:hypothetical protein
VADERQGRGRGLAQVPVLGAWVKRDVSLGLSTFFSDAKVNLEEIKKERKINK